MKLIHRVGYYLGGFSIGLIFLAFFLSGKRVSCAYGPNARVLKNISYKKLQYSDSIKNMVASHQIDSATISLILNQGDVDFPYIKTEVDTCKIYIIEKTVEAKELALTVENCDSVATVKSVSIKNAQ